MGCLQDPPEYFDPPGGLLLFHMELPEGIIQAAAPHKHTLELDSHKDGHFALVNEQLRQVGHALTLCQRQPQCLPLLVLV